MYFLQINNLISLQIIITLTHPLQFLLSRYKLLGRLGYGLNICYEIINSLVIELFSAVNNDKIVERICVATVAFMLHYLSIPYF